jgi:hypothetical protein
METKECKWFLERVQIHFNYLFEKYGFRIIFTEDDHLGEHCLIVIESAHCRVRYIFDRGSLEVSVGALSSSPGWHDFDNGELKWFSMREVIEYINGQPRRTSEELYELGEVLFAMTVDEHLEWLAKSMRPIYSNVIELFLTTGSDKDTFLRYYNS